MDSGEPHASASPSSRTTPAPLAAADLPSGPASPPRPLEALREAPVPPFLTKTYDLVEDPALDAVVSWGPRGGSFVVWDPARFTTAVLPQHFKHRNFSSFVRQLNTYGFRKIDTDRWEFANENFQQGKKHLLKDIRRRRSPPSSSQIIGSSSSSAAMENSGLSDDVHKLSRERSFLMHEVVKLREEQLMTMDHVNSVKQRMRSAEQRQRLMASFLAKILQNPSIIENLRNRREGKGYAPERVKRKFLKHKLPEQIGLGKHMIDNQMANYIESNSGESSSLFDFEDFDSGTGEQHGEYDLFHVKDQDQDYPTAVRMFSLTENMEAKNRSTQLADTSKGKSVICSNTGIISTSYDIETNVTGLADRDTYKEDVRTPNVDANSNLMSYPVPQQYDNTSEHTSTDVLLPVCESADIPSELWSISFASQDTDGWEDIVCSSGKELVNAEESSLLWELGLQNDLGSLQFENIISDELAIENLDVTANR